MLFVACLPHYRGFWFLWSHQPSWGQMWPTRDKYLGHVTSLDQSGDKIFMWCQPPIVLKKWHARLPLYLKSDRVDQAILLLLRIEILIQIAWLGWKSCSRVITYADIFLVKAKDRVEETQVKLRSRSDNLEVKSSLKSNVIFNLKGITMTKVLKHRGVHWFSQMGSAVKLFQPK